MPRTFILLFISTLMAIASVTASARGLGGHGGLHGLGSQLRPHATDQVPNASVPPDLRTAADASHR